MTIKAFVCDSKAKMEKMEINPQYNVTVQNRFENLQEREMDKGDNPGEILTRDVFAQSTMDEKMLLMFDELRFIRQEQVNCSKGNFLMQQSLSQMSAKLNLAVQITNDQTTLMRTLAYKSIDVEARSRRDNLVFRGFCENSDENCTQILLTFLEERLGITPGEITINRAHRLGARNFNKTGNRPIIANFRDHSDVVLIMSRTNMLKNVPVSVDYDFPREIQEARSRLWPLYKQYRNINKTSKVKIVYPAKLIVDGRLVRDEMPEWDICMRNTRLPNINYINQQDRRQHISPNTYFIPENVAAPNGQQVNTSAVPVMSGQVSVQTNNVTGLEPMNGVTMMSNSQPVFSLQQPDIPPTQNLSNITQGAAQFPTQYAPQQTPAVPTNNMFMKFATTVPNTSNSINIGSRTIPTEHHIHVPATQQHVPMHNSRPTHTEQLQVPVCAPVQLSTVRQQAYNPVVIEQSQPKQQLPEAQIKQNVDQILFAMPVHVSNPALTSEQSQTVLDKQYQQHTEQSACPRTEQNTNASVPRPTSIHTVVNPDPQTTLEIKKPTTTENSRPESNIPVKNLSTAQNEQSQGSSANTNTVNKGVAHISRANQRRDRRSQSATPYNRQDRSSSQKRDSPKPMNRQASRDPPTHTKD